MQISHSKWIRTFGALLITLFVTYYSPLDGVATNAPIKTALMATAIAILLIYTFKISKALIISILYLGIQFVIASFHPESFRWSTLIYSTMLVLTYVCFYNLLYIEKIFNLEFFIKICKGMMMAYFIVCIIQQILIIIGITYLPLINMMYTLNRGIGCQSLALEPSHFARLMLVFYYAYMKCQEYKRGEGPFTIKELFSDEHKWVTIRFLWMMLTMGSGTAFVCLILLSLYFVRKHNWYYTIPILIVAYSLIQASGIEALDRATSTIEATTTLDAQTVRETDSSAAARITPILNSLNADFTKFDTWFGKGIDAGHTIGNNSTLFEDYGFFFYLISLIFNFTCAYNFWSLATIFMFAGVGGGTGNNIQLAWGMMMIMTCVKYFHDNRDNPEIYEEEEDYTDSDRDKETQQCPT